MYRFLKYFISFLLIWLLSCTSSLTAQHVKDYRLAIEKSMGHGPMASLSYEELREIKEIFAAAKTEEETKSLWKTLVDFIEAYKIGNDDAQELVSAYQALISARNINVACGVSLSDKTSKFASVLSPLFSKLANYKFGVAKTTSFINLKITINKNSNIDFKTDTLICTLSKDIPKTDADLIQSTFKSLIKDRIKLQSFKSIQEAQDVITPALLSFLKTLNDKLNYKGSIENNEVVFDGSITPKSFPDTDIKNQDVSNPRGIQDFAGLSAQEKASLQSLIDKFAQTYSVRAVVTSTDNKTVITNGEVKGNPMTSYQQVLKDFSLPGKAALLGKDLAVWIHYNKEEKKIYYKFLAKDLKLSPRFKGKAPAMASLEGIRNNAVKDAIDNEEAFEDDHLTWFERACWVFRITDEALAQGKTPRPMWRKVVEDGVDPYPVRSAPLVAGISDGIIDELKSVPEFLNLVLTVFNPTKWGEVYETVTSINAKQVASDIYEDKKLKYSTSDDVAEHELGVDAVVIASLLIGGELQEGAKALKTIKEILANLPEIVRKKISKIIPPDEILKDLAKYKELFEKIRLKPELVDSWIALRGTKYRTNIEWLERVNSWKVAGLKYVQIGEGLKILNKDGVELATYINKKFVVSKWKASYKGSVIGDDLNGYKLIQNGNDLGFDLGFKEGRRLDADEVNDYLIKAKENKPDGQPYRRGSFVNERLLEVGEKVYVVENAADKVTGSNIPNPGGWGSKNKIRTEKELRDYLAVLESWKKSNGITDPLVVREYTVKHPLPVRDGVIGPQMEVFPDKSYKVYFGGEQQYEFIEYPGNGVWKKYFELNVKVTVLK